MNAIIIAAGSGKRISDDIKDTPKSLVKINEKPIIEYQMSVLNQVGINDIIIITGPYGEKFELTNVQYVKDHNYHKHDILGSLMAAKEFLKNDVLVMYSDIIFDLKIIEEVLDSNGDITIAVDLNWEKSYVGRTEHPKSEAENVLLDKFNKITKIRKNIQDKDGQIGEFLGIMKLTTRGSAIFVKKFEELLNNHRGAFQQAPSIPKAYLTDMIQELIDSNIDVKPIFISGKWREIDTMQDLKNAEKLFSS